MKNKTFLSSRSFRKGVLSTIITIVVIVAIVVVNVVATALAQKYPFSVDLTANKDYTVSLSDEYNAFVKGIDKTVSITVCAAESDFNNDTYAAAMVQNLGLTDYMNGLSESTQKYGRQVSAFLKSFHNLNDMITVTFVDPNSVTEFSSISQKYSDETLDYGDIIVACTHPSAEGDTTFERNQILKMTDIFTVEANEEAYYTGTQYYYDITGSSLAGDTVSALYVVTNETSIEVAVLGGHGWDSTYIDGLRSFLGKNNYTFTQIDSLLTDDIPETATFALIASPKNDYTKDEIKALEDFLKNDGEYGRSLVYLPTADQPTLPNLEEFLAEWGIQILSALVIEQEQTLYSESPVYLFAQTAGSEYTTDFDSEKQYFYPTSYRGTNVMFEEQGGYKTETILKSSDSSVAVDLNKELPDDWQPSDAEYQGPFELAILGTYQSIDSSAGVVGESHVLMVSGDNFIHQEILSSSACYNSTMLLNLFNGLSNQDEGNTVSIEDKVISTSNFYEKILNTNAVSVMGIIFIGVIPVAMVAIGVAVWVIRKRK